MMVTSALPISALLPRTRLLIWLKSRESRASSVVETVGIVKRLTIASSRGHASQESVSWAVA